MLPEFGAWGPCLLRVQYRDPTSGTKGPNFGPIPENKKLLAKINSQSPRVSISTMFHFAWQTEAYKYEYITIHHEYSTVGCTWGNHGTRGGNWKAQETE